MWIRFAAVLAACLLLAACDLAAPAGERELEGEWNLVGGAHAGAAVPIPEGAPITLSVADAEARGRAACNIYSGELTVDGDRLSFGSMAVTEMGCHRDVMDAEAAYLAALAAVERWSRVGDRLTLSGADVELTYELIPPIADADLVGTTWRLDSLIEGETVSSTMRDPATLELGEDGTMHGTTGCRTFEGRYEASDDAVRVVELVNDDRACPGLETQDEHVLAVLGDGFAYEITGNRLTLTAGRLRLSYVAGEE